MHSLSENSSFASPIKAKRTMFFRGTSKIVYDLKKTKLVFKVLIIKFINICFIATCN